MNKSLQVLVLLMLSSVALAGCLDGDDPQEADSGAQTDLPAEPQNEEKTEAGATVSKNATEVETRAESEGEGEYQFPDGYPVFCDENQKGQGVAGEVDCTFYDDIYHGYTLYDVDTPKIDVIIAPPASPEAARDIETLRMSVEAWRDGITELGEPWFVDAFQMNVYVAGEDDIPEDAIQDPEIVVLAAEFNPTLLFGIGLEPYDFIGMESPCRDDDAESLRYPDHAHHGMRIMSAECEDGGFTCFAINTNFAFPTGNAHTMYDLVAHEVGHCLGPGHVGDALDFAAKRVPIADIMSYTPIEDQVHCVSNLNVRVIEGIYGDLIDERPWGAAPLLESGDFVHMHPADYHNVECENPPTGILS